MNIVESQIFGANQHSSTDNEILQFNQIQPSVAELSLVPSCSKTRKKTKKTKTQTILAEVEHY